jgi:cell wall-associated NlpC family hydrolase
MATRHRSLFTTAVLAATIAIGIPMAASANADTSPAPSTSVTAGVDASAAPKPTPAVPTAAQRAAAAKAHARAVARARAAGKLRAQNRIRAHVVALAKSKVGDRYVWGAVGPRRFDCSGLAKYVYAHAAHKSLPHYSRAQFHKLRHVSTRARKPGDLVFFLRGGMEHVGIYIGGGRMVNAQSPRSGVRVAALSAGWVSPHYSGAGSLF